MKTPGRKLWALALAFLLAAGSGLFALAQQQEPPTEQKQGPIQPKPEEDDKTPYALRVEVPLVEVDVAVTDRKSGTFIPGLKKEHFRLYVDGQEQEIAAFAPTEAPLTTVLVVEATPAFGYLIRYDNLDSAYLFLRQLRKDDWVAVVGYDMRPRIEADFTHDPQEAIQALRMMQFGGFSEANMYDAIIDTLDRLKDVEGKKSIIVIGTGIDTFSKHTWDDARKAAREHRTTIFCIGTAWPIIMYLDRAEAAGYRIGADRMTVNLAEAQMRDLAEQTGGRAYFPRFITELPNIYGDIGAMLRNQYTLAFHPKPFNKDGKFHKIEVKLVAPDGKPLKVVNQDQKEVKVEVRARKGYYAPES
ncbi:MAG: VWA domain-containing protein [Candidatus Acidiferrales bacterium]